MLRVNAVRQTGLVLGVLALILASGIAPAASAERNPVYTVSRMPVDVTAETATLARARALLDGQRRALSRLLRRITLAADAPLMPELTDEQITSLVQGFEVHGEKTSTVRYLAEVTFGFKRREVRTMLTDANIAFAETMSLPVLVVPVYASAGAMLLWEDENRWREAWQKLSARDGLVPVQVPLGDLADLRDLNADQAILPDLERLAAIAERHGARDSVVAQARITIDVRTNTRVLEITVERHGLAKQGVTVVDSVRGEALEEVGLLLDRGVGRVALEIEESWKRENLVTPGLETRVTAMVPISSFSRWLEIRRKLEGIAVLARWDLVRMTTREAVADLWVQGDPEQLRLALAQSDLELIERPSFWILKPRDEDLPDAYKEIVLTPIPASAPVAPPATTDQSAPLAAPVVPPKQ